MAGDSIYLKIRITSVYQNSLHFNLQHDILNLEYLLELTKVNSKAFMIWILKVKILWKDTFDTKLKLQIFKFFLYNSTNLSTAEIIKKIF